MKRGRKPTGKVDTTWSTNLAYAIGLLTADGHLSKDSRHIDLTSKDLGQIKTFKKCLGLDTKIGTKFSGAGIRCYRVQFGDVIFYRFLENIGLSPAKSKIISAVSIPEDFFADFLRGYFDGDGTSSSFYDPVFVSSYRFYVSFSSASPVFVHWLRNRINLSLGITGHITKQSGGEYFQLRYAKRESILFCSYIYYKKELPCLRRKYLKIKNSLGIINRRRSGEIGNHATFRS